MSHPLVNADGEFEKVARAGARPCQRIITGLFCFLDEDSLLNDVIILCLMMDTKMVIGCFQSCHGPKREHLPVVSSLLHIRV